MSHAGLKTCWESICLYRQIQPALRDQITANGMGCNKLSASEVQAVEAGGCFDCRGRANWIGDGLPPLQMFVTSTGGDVLG